MDNDGVRAQLYYDAHKKSQGAAYLLWFFLGGLGAHRFYVGRAGTGVAQLLLCLFGWLPLFAGLFALSIWWIVDAFLIPDMLRQANMEVADRVMGQSSPMRRRF